MNVGDLVRATWTDGMVAEGIFVGHTRGYIILQGAEGESIVCCPNTVKFEVINE